MPLLGFQSRFAPLVESGEKRQTIRAYRKDGRDPKAGDRLYLWTGLRQPGARKLGESICLGTRHVVIGRDGYKAFTSRGGTPLGLGSCESFALADGFDGWTALADWFERAHGFPFHGILIGWGEIEPGGEGSSHE